MSAPAFVCNPYAFYSLPEATGDEPSGALR